MKDTDQIAIEAARETADQIRIDTGNYYNSELLLERAFKSAIEKATEVIERDRCRVSEELTFLRRAARASEPVFEVSKHHPSCTVSDQDLMWVCAQCGLTVPARASEQSNDLPGSWQEANKDPLRNEYNA